MGLMMDPCSALQMDLPITPNTRFCSGYFETLGFHGKCLPFLVEGGHDTLKNGRVCGAFGGLLKGAKGYLGSGDRKPGYDPLRRLLACC